MNVSVTGATGFIGQHLVPRLVDSGRRVRCLTRSIARARTLPALTGAELCEADLTSVESLRRAVRPGDTVVHLAAALGPTADHPATNVTGTRSLLEACAATGVHRFVHVTSSAALGSARGPWWRPLSPIDESHPARPSTPYGHSKHRADLLVQSFHARRGLPAVSLRFTHVYGPGDDRDFLRIVRWIQRGVFPQVGLRPNYFPALYVDDAVEALTLALTEGRTGETYIVTDSDPHDTRDIRRQVRRLLGLPRRPYPVLPAVPSLLSISVVERACARLGLVPPIRASNIRNLASSRVFSIAKARRELGFEPAIDFETGLRRTIAWYRAEGLL